MSLGLGAGVAIPTYEDQMLNMDVAIGQLQGAVARTQQALDSLYILVLSILVLFMQFGFGLFEAGISRNSFTIKKALIKNYLCTMMAIMWYWCWGYAIYWGLGTPVWGGSKYWFYSNMQPADFPKFLMSFALVITSVNIALGALAERASWVTYLLFTFVWAGWLHPFVQHWVWNNVNPGGGWLALVLPYWDVTVGFIDSSGAAVVHMMGGIPALVGAVLLGPRTDRFDAATGQPVSYRPHSSTLIFIGGAIVQVGMLAFNALGYGSITGDPNNPDSFQLMGFYACQAVVNSVISAGTSAFIVYVVLLALRMPSSLVRVLCGGLTGMVAISSSTGHLYPWAALLIGLFSAFVYLFWSWLLQKFKVDDVTDSFAVHCGGGMWGVLVTSLLHTDYGLFFINSGRGTLLLLWQFVGLVAIWIWAAGWSLIIFGSLRIFKLIRVGQEVEMRGIDRDAYTPTAGPPARSQEYKTTTGSELGGIANPIYSQ